jgi:diguanylate cyclase (GGDEF)-like protein/PAS domain S-box-containing protein
MPLRSALVRKPLLLVLILLACLLALGALLHQQARTTAQATSLETTLSAASLSSRAVYLWLEERRADADVVATSPLFQNALRMLTGRSGTTDRSFVNSTLQQHLELIRTRYHYRAIVLFDLATRQPLLMTGGVDYSPAMFERMFNTIDGSTGRWVEMAGDATGELRAGLVRAIGHTPPLSRYGLFFEFDVSRLSASLNHAEAEAQGIDVLLHVIHPLGAGRYYVLTEQTPLVRETTAAQAAGSIEQVLGLSGGGRAQGRDHRGREVYAQAVRVPETPWTVIATQTRQRAYVRAETQARVVNLALGGLFLLGLLLIQIWRRGEKLRSLARENELMRQREILFNSAEGANLTFDASGTIIEANAAAHRLYGYPTGRLIGLHMQVLRPPEGRQAQQAFFTQCQPGESHTFQAELQRADGRRFLAEVTTGMSEVDGRRLLHSSVRDVTARQAIETRLRIAASFFERSNAAILIADTEGRVQMVNTAFCRVTGYSAEELMGQPWAGLQRCVAQVDAQAAAAGQDPLLARAFWEGELAQQHKDGSSYPSRVILTAYSDAQGRIEQYVMVHTDLTRIHEAETRLQYVASRDQLTGLPNRTQMERSIEELVQQTQQGGGPFVFVMLNLDRWRSINDSVGFTTADQLLRLVAERLSQHLLGEHHVFRFGGDEFAVLLTGEAAADYGTLMDRLLITMVQPLQLGAQTFQLTCSAGVSLCPGLALTRDDLVTQASIALQTAKLQGRNTWRLYNPAMGHSSYEDLALMQDLRQAVARGELSLHLQPQFATTDRRLIGMEALLRWKHPERGNIPPITFIPMAESSGLITEIGHWVLHEACRLWSSWRAQGLAPPPIAVNLSALQFHQAHFIGDIAQALQEHGLPPGALELEITESLLMSDVDVAIGRMHELERMGVRLSIDDFGTGYSSLAYLRRFPVHKLKIDRSFVTDLEQDGGAIAVAVINMAKSLRLIVIAEGVETEEQFDFLRIHGCDEVQGYLCGKPMPATDMQRLLPRAGG